MVRNCDTYGRIYIAVCGIPANDAKSAFTTLRRYQCHQALAELGLASLGVSFIKTDAHKESAGNIRENHLGKLSGLELVTEDTPHE